MRAYSILGGIPYYLLQFDGGKGIEDNIIRRILSNEEICREYVARKNNALILGAFYAAVGRWWSKSDEIDVFASFADGKNLLLGECRFRKNPFYMHDFNSLMAKVPCERRCGS